MKILVTDDNMTSRLILAAALKKIGHEVFEAGNGREAWELLRQPGAPGLAILDWVMPEMDGIEVIGRMRALESALPPPGAQPRRRAYLIILTGRGEKEDIIAGLDAGADDYLIKPFHPGELRARVAVGCRFLEIQDELLTVRNALAYEAAHDPLTGVLNRRAIETTLSRELSREKRHHEGLALGVFDIDFFKSVNDANNHQVGDEVLCGIVELLKTRLREHDYLVRFGGDEFLIIAPGVTGENAKGLFESLRALIADNPISTSAGKISVTISIGVRTAHGDETPAGMLLAADAALYQAKSSGRNRVCFDAG